MASPLLDDVSIGGAKGVLINITGGMDLAIDEVTQISMLIQEEAGDEAEIIFGAVHDPELEEEVRVTVIATGFEYGQEQRNQVLTPNFGVPQQVEVPAMQQEAAGGAGPVNPFVAPSPTTPVVPEEPGQHAAGRPGVVTRTPGQITEIEMPTFIRRTGA